MSDQSPEITQRSIPSEVFVKKSTPAKPSNIAEIMTPLASSDSKSPIVSTSKKEQIFAKELQNM